MLNHEQANSKVHHTSPFNLRRVRQDGLKKSKQNSIVPTVERKRNGVTNVIKKGQLWLKKEQTPIIIKKIIRPSQSANLGPRYIISSNLDIRFSTAFTFCRLSRHVKWSSGRRCIQIYVKKTAYCRRKTQPSLWDLSGL